MESRKNIATNDQTARIGVFVPDDALRVFDASFLDEMMCRSLVIGSVTVNLPPRCPDCGENIKQSLLPSFWEGRRIKCWSCGKYFTALTGTFLSGCHFNYRELVLLAFMLALGADDKKITEKLNVSAESVRLWRLKFKELEKIKQ